MDNTEISSTENSCGSGCSAPATDKSAGSPKLGGICGAPPAPAPPVAPPPTTAVTTAPLELHVCMGLNSCKGHDRYGTNSCAGAGWCATAYQHVCRTLNNCHGQGGCGLYGTAEDDATPGANECSGQGACAVPIQAERFSTQGANKGLSVWVLARKLFVERMQKANRTIGASPYQCGPPQAWLIEALGSYDSCGSAGNKAGTFGFNDPAKDAQELCEKSLHPVLCGGPEHTDSNHCAADKVHCNAPKEGSDTGGCGTPEKGGDTNLCSSVEKSRGILICGEPNVKSEQPSEESSDDK